MTMCIRHHSNTTQIDVTYEWPYERISEDFCWSRKQSDLMRHLNTDINMLYCNSAKQWDHFRLGFGLGYWSGVLLFRHSSSVYPERILAASHVRMHQGIPRL